MYVRWNSENPLRDGQLKVLASTSQHVACGWVVVRVFTEHQAREIQPKNNIYLSVWSESRTSPVSLSPSCILTSASASPGSSPLWVGMMMMTRDLRAESGGRGGGFSYVNEIPCWHQVGRGGNANSRHNVGMWNFPWRNNAVGAQQHKAQCRGNNDAPFHSFNVPPQTSAWLPPSRVIRHFGKAPGFCSALISLNLLIVSAAVLLLLGMNWKLHRSLPVPGAMLHYESGFSISQDQIADSLVDLIPITA